MLARHASRLEQYDDLSDLWGGLVEVLGQAGIEHVIYLTVDRDFGAPFVRATMPEFYREHIAAEDPFLSHCCSSYDIMPTGVGFVDDYDDLTEAERSLIKDASVHGFVTGIAIPMRLLGSERFGGFNLGTALSRPDFEREVLPRAEEFRAFCLLVHRRIEELSETGPDHGPDFRNRLIAPDLPSRFDILSPREREVVYLLAQGITRKEAAHMCGISVHTVSEYAKGAFAKLGVRNRAQVAKMIFSQAAE